MSSCVSGDVDHSAVVVWWWFGAGVGLFMVLFMVSLIFWGFR